MSISGNGVEKVLWSIAIPGFGQFLNKTYLKGIILIILEFIIKRAGISISGVRDNITEAEVSAAIDVVIAKNIFYSSGGGLVTKNSAQVTERNVTALEVK